MRADIFINLCGIYINMQNFCIFRKFRSISCYTITETCSCYNQQITFGNTKVGALRSMHSYHAGIKLVISVKGAFSHQGICHRSLDSVRQGPQLLAGIRQHSAAAYENKGLL